MVMSTLSSSPFYLFGYGSLLWRPGDLLGAFPSYICTAYNWKRLFVQRSCDHRGFPEYPGLVATLVDDDDFRSIGDGNQHRLHHHVSTPSIDNSDESKSECVGLVWLIPQEARDALLEELDFREKGGYTRHSITVRLHQETPYHTVDELTEAIVYTGAITNPLFDFKPLKLGSEHYYQTNSKLTSSSNYILSSGLSSSPSPVSSSSSSSSSSSCTISSSTSAVSSSPFSLLRPRNPGASIISASKGPSGTNIEYLFGLAKFIQQNGLRDDYIDHLCHDVLLRVGTWRAKNLYQHYLTNKPAVSYASSFARCIKYLKDKAVTDNNDINNDHSNNTSVIMTSHSKLKLIGWGSNEFHQLKPTVISKTKEITIINDIKQINEDDGLLIKNPIVIDYLDDKQDDDNTLYAENTTKATIKRVSFSLLDNSTVIKFHNNSCILSHYHHHHHHHSSSSSSISSSNSNGDSKHQAHILTQDYNNSNSIPSVAYLRINPNFKPNNAGKQNDLTMLGKADDEQEDFNKDSSSSCSNVNNNSTDCSFIEPTIPTFLNEHVIAGAKWSGRLKGTTLTLWGDGLDELFELESAETVALDVTAVDLLSENKKNDKQITSVAMNLVIIEGVTGCAIGYNHTLLQLSTNGQVIGLGDNSNGQCIGVVPLPFQLLSSDSNTLAAADSAIKVGGDGEEKVLKLAVGLKHSAAITTSGKLYTWGQNLHNQSLCNIYHSGADYTTEPIVGHWVSKLNNHSIGVWQPPSSSPSSSAPVLLIDIACGAKHTCCVDDYGRIWSFGSNNYDALGRPIIVDDKIDSSCISSSSSSSSSSSINRSRGRVNKKDGVPALVNTAAIQSSSSSLSLESSGIRWQRISCGWHHTVARGVRTDGSSVLMGFGRRDMHQFPFISAADENPSVNSVHQSQPCELSPLPNAAEMSEVWCGSEYTIVADDAGLLWACGWNEHANLTSSSSSSSSSTPADNSVADVRNGSNTEITKDININNDIVSEWQPVRYHTHTPASHHTIRQADIPQQQSDSLTQVRLGVLWEGSLAAGGGHVICLTLNDDSCSSNTDSYT